MPRSVCDSSFLAGYEHVFFLLFACWGAVFSAHSAVRVRILAFRFLVARDCLFSSFFLPFSRALLTGAAPSGVTAVRTHIRCRRLRRVRVRQCAMQLTYEVDGRRRRLLAINVGKYLSAFPVIWLTGYQAMQEDHGARHVSILLCVLCFCVFLCVIFSNLSQGAKKEACLWGGFVFEGRG